VAGALAGCTLAALLGALAYRGARGLLTRDAGPGEARD
jgi:hypothetical protein